ncbi:MAG: tRNA (adenosine(37)-N6)-threonylcarbamoyltransferase complex transferase subunit TsaD [Bacteroidetes bacterium 4572_77]|nr:MAG: tRNA (adenosine(37)-N6)-threonylcarbamoyltransferase complex transferase subunit TsaD [Bacteroidetes bacterium 4572_77]
MCTYILGIESSCDDTSAAIIKDDTILSNIIANQAVHHKYGGVVPELASRSHQQNIIPVIHSALQQAKINKNQLSAIAFTRGPGLLGSLLVGTSFAKSFALGLNIPLIEIDHLQAHILAHFAQKPEKRIATPNFPFLCLTVSGGHSQIVKVNSYFDMEILGQTIDDAAGEAFDKTAKIMSLGYPGGPVIDKLAQEGDAHRFSFPFPKIPDYNYSFSGIKTSVLYFLRDELKKDDDFIEKNKKDIAASVQYTIVETLMRKLVLAAKDTGIKEIAIAGGVSANSGLRKAISQGEQKYGWNTYIPAFEFTTDNAAMIAITGLFKYKEGIFTDQKTSPYARSKFKYKKQ